MTKRTSAANATPSSPDTPDRRMILASAGAAAVLAAIGVSAVAEPVDPDAALLALRQPYDQTLALMDHHAPAHSRAEEAFFALRSAEPGSSERSLRKRSGLTVAERAYRRATDANLKVIDRISALPARTLAGVIFKAEVSRREDNMDRDLIASIMTDIAKLTAAQPSVRI